MGVACPHLSDDPGYTMVDPSGGSCRCACQEDFSQDPLQEQQSSGCCSPHVFTSVLLGILSCVLMTGGVFLAFHRWDPMWLMVSGVGVVLILIGTVLHCCNNLHQRPKRRSSAGKGCCPRPLPPDHHHHVMPSGSLTEQLLPLSNARSVSQLSLNMLPGYFPPVVTAYGIEQHSAVVQNINRLVQQQQSQPSTTGSCSPGVSSAAGKSFIVLSLPTDAATSANIQNLVATVYQLDGSAVETPASDASQNGAAPVSAAKQNSPVSLILKNAEVQTCSLWPATPAAASGGEIPGTSRSPPAVDSPAQPATGSSSAVTGSTQTDDLPPVLPEETVNLMDCSTDIAPICDNATNSCDNQTTDALVDIPSDVLGASSTDAVECSGTSVLVDIPEPPAENLNPPPTTTTTLLLDVVVTTPPNVRCSEVLVDIMANSDPSRNDILMDASAQESASASDILIDLPENADSNLQSLNPELLSSSGNLSTSDTEIDDGELMDRSSPPPSYEDVTLEGESVGAFGLAYGTI